MKVVVIGPVYPYRGGISQYTGLMSQNLAKEHEVTNISFKMQYPQFLYRKEQKDFANTTFQVKDAKYWINTINPITWFLAARRINALRPNLIIVQWWHPFFAPVYWSLLKMLHKGITVIFCCHNVLPHEEFPFKRLLAKRVLRQGSGYIVQSAQDAADLCALLPQPQFKQVVHPTYNAFCLRNLSKEVAREQLHIKENEKILLFFGFIRKYKGLKHLLRAMPAILRQLPDVHLFVVGEFFEGNKQDYLELIKQLNLPEGTLTLIDGYLPDKEVEPYFAACDLVVLPYESATQSGIVQIAYGFEKPVVATAVGGLPEVVLDGQTGFIVPPLDDTALGEAVIRFFMEEKAAEFQEIICCEAYKYSWDRINETIEQLYRECKK